MASHSDPRILTFKADGAIAKGKAVKGGTDDDHLAVCAANTDKAVGICQSAVLAAEDAMEVALPGGGAKGLCGETVAVGDLLVSHTDGSLVKKNAIGDRVIAMALQAGVSGDLIAVEVMASDAAQAG
jgi:hypothetical protein